MADQVSVQRLIGAPAEKVWEMVTDITRMGEWSPETTSCSWVGETTKAVPGARFKGNNRKGWRRWSTSARVVDAEPGVSFVFDVTAGPLPVARWDYRFEPDGEGCLVIETWTDQRNAVAKALGGPVSGVADRCEHNRASMVETLERLAVVAEGS